MLHKTTVAETTLDIIKSVCSLPELTDFYLAGGTALSLQIGHRKSIDMDFFTNNSFDANQLNDLLAEELNFKRSYIEKNTLKGTINEDFVDFITHKYPLTKPLITEEGIRMASMSDIAAMKINAIAGSGERLKDFVDIAYMGSKITLKNMVDSYRQKYGSDQTLIILKALLYFDDINYDVKIDIMDDGFSVEKMKKQIEAMCQNPDKLLPE